MNRSWIVIVAAVIAGAAAAEPASDLNGCWIGYAVVGHEATSLRLKVKSEDGATKVWLDIPEMGATGVGPAPVERSGSTVKAGPLEFELTSEGRLTGNLGILDPVDRPQVVFRRSTWLDADCELLAGPPSLETIWETDAGAGVWAEPLYDTVTRSLFVGTIGGRLLALDALQGAEIWSRALEGSIRSSAALAGDRVIIASDDGRLTALSSRNGSLIWQREIAASLDPPFQPVPGSEYHYRGHQVHSSRNGLFVGTLEGAVLRIDPEDGKTLESVDLGSAVTAIVERREGGIAVSTLDGSVRAFSDGLKERWRFRSSGAIYGDLLDDGSRLYAGDRAYYLYAIDSSTGALVWKRKLWFSWFDSGAILHDGILYAGSSDSRAVRALDPASGAVLWKTEVGGWAWAKPVMFEGLIVEGVAGVAKYLAKHEPGVALLDPISGSLLDRQVVQPKDKGVYGTVATPVVVGDTLFVGDARGGIKAMKLR